MIVFDFAFGLRWSETIPQNSAILLAKWKFVLVSVSAEEENKVAHFYSSSKKSRRVDTVL